MGSEHEAKIAALQDENTELKASVDGNFRRSTSSGTDGEITRKDSLREAADAGVLARVVELERELENLREAAAAEAADREEERTRLMEISTIVAQQNQASLAEVMEENKELKEKLQRLESGNHRGAEVNHVTPMSKEDSPENNAWNNDGWDQSDDDWESASESGDKAAKKD